MGGGGVNGGPHVLRYVIDFRSAMQCIKIGYRLYKVLRWGISMVSFHGLCDGKIMVRKTKNFWFLCENVFIYFDLKNFFF